jgi:hypothetical protein
MVFLLLRRSGVAPFGSLKKSSVRSALMLKQELRQGAKEPKKLPSAATDAVEFRFFLRTWAADRRPG